MRWYSIDSDDGPIKLPSVSTVLDVTKPPADRAILTMAQAKDPLGFQKRTQAARNRGDYVDLYVKNRLLKKPLVVDARYSKFCAQANKFIDQVSGERILSDQFVYDLDRQYAGTFDLLVELPWGLTLVDIKTCAHEPFDLAVESALLQGAAYSAAWSKANMGLRPVAIAAVFVSPYNLTMHVKQGAEFMKYIEAFYTRLSSFGSCLNQANASA